MTARKIAIVAGLTALEFAMSLALLARMNPSKQAWNFSIGATAVVAPLAALAGGTPALILFLIFANPFAATTEALLLACFTGGGCL